MIFKRDQYSFVERTVIATGDLRRKSAEITSRKGFTFQGTQRQAVEVFFKSPNDQRAMFSYAMNILAFSKVDAMVERIRYEGVWQQELRDVTTGHRRVRRIEGSSIQVWLQHIGLGSVEGLSTDDLQRAIDTKWQETFGNDTTSPEADLRRIGRKFIDPSISSLREEDRNRIVASGMEELGNKGYWPLLAVLDTNVRRGTDESDFIDAYIGSVIRAFIGRERGLTAVEQFIELSRVIDNFTHSNRFIPIDLLDDVHALLRKVDTSVLDLFDAMAGEHALDINSVVQEQLRKAGVGRYEAGDWNSFALNLPIEHDFMDRVENFKFWREWKKTLFNSLERKIKSGKTLDFPEGSPIKRIGMFRIEDFSMGVFIVTSDDKLLHFQVLKEGQIHGIPNACDTLAYGIVHSDYIAKYLVKTFINGINIEERQLRRGSELVKQERKTQEPTVILPSTKQPIFDTRVPPVQRAPQRGSHKREKLPAWQRAMARKQTEVGASDQEQNNNFPPKIISVFSKDLIEAIVGVGLDMKQIRAEVHRVNDLLTVPGRDYGESLKKLQSQPGDTSIQIYRFQWAISDFRIIMAKVAITEQGKKRILFLPLELIEHKILDRAGSKVPAWEAQAQKMRDEIQEHINNLEED